MVEIFLLEQLVAFSQAGTLSKAAETLHITQPALSRSMKKLESEFGVSLFERSKSKIALNETGKIAAKWAQKVLAADQEMVARTVAFDQSRQVIAVGSCASLPVATLVPLLQEHWNNKTITTKVADDEELLTGLKTHRYQLVVTHHQPDDPDLFCQRYLDEQLSVSFPMDHPLAKRKEVTFTDLEGMSILAHGTSGFWLEICRQNLNDTKLLVQDRMDDLHELIDSSSLPAFHSNRALECGFESADRVVVPIRDQAAYAIYFLVCLASKKKEYEALFKTIQSRILKERPLEDGKKKDAI